MQEHVIWVSWVLRGLEMFRLKAFNLSVLSIQGYFWELWRCWDSNSTWPKRLECWEVSFDTWSRRLLWSLRLHLPQVLHMELVHDSRSFALKICHLPLEECVCTLKTFKHDLLHLKKKLGHINHSKIFYLASNMPKTLKYLRLYFLHLKRSIKSLKSFQPNFLHLKRALIFHIHQVKFSTPQEKSSDTQITKARLFSRHTCLTLSNTLIQFLYTLKKILRHSNHSNNIFFSSND